MIISIKDSLFLRNGELLGHSPIHHIWIIFLPVYQEYYNKIKIDLKNFDEKISACFIAKYLSIFSFPDLVLLIHWNFLKCLYFLNITFLCKNGFSLDFPTVDKTSCYNHPVYMVTSNLHLVISKMISDWLIWEEKFWL
jgi:hypothetical protein